MHVETHGSVDVIVRFSSRLATPRRRDWGLSTAQSNAVGDLTLSPGVEDSPAMASAIAPFFNGELSFYSMDIAAYFVGW